MATLTYDSTPADQPEFNEAEQEALQIGEAAAAEQNQMLAGKFKDAEALEQAYLELQKKLGDNNDETEELRNEEEAAEEEVTEEPSEAAVAITEASAEWYEKGELSTETVEKLTAMSSEDLLAAYIESQRNAPEASTPDLTEQQVAQIQADVGGPEEYSQVMSWAAENLPQDMVEAYDNMVERGDTQSIRLALAGIQAAYENNVGRDGQTLTGKPAVQQNDVFRSQAEVLQAMQDPRYDSDPAYRNDVFEKLGRSNIEY